MEASHRAKEAVTIFLPSSLIFLEALLIFLQGGTVGATRLVLRPLIFLVWTFNFYFWYFICIWCWSFFCSFSYWSMYDPAFGVASSSAPAAGPAPTPILQLLLLLLDWLQWQLSISVTLKQGQGQWGHFFVETIRGGFYWKYTRNYDRKSQIYLL